MPPCRSSPRLMGTRRTVVSFMRPVAASRIRRSEEHTSELQSQSNLVCRLLLEKKKKDLVVVDLSNPSSRIDISDQDHEVIIEFSKTSLLDNLRRILDVADFGAPLNAVITFLLD